MTFAIYTSTLITDSNNNILLVTEKKEVNFNKLNLPGGHLEEGESPMEWAVREAKEETGVDIELTGLIGIYLGRSNSSFHYIFSGTIISGIPRWNPSEVLSAQWYSLDDINALPDNAFVYIEKLHDVLEKFQTNNLIPIDLVIRDLRKIT